MRLNTLTEALCITTPEESRQFLQSIRKHKNFQKVADEYDVDVSEVMNVFRRYPGTSIASPAPGVLRKLYVILRDSVPHSILDKVMQFHKSGKVLYITPEVEEHEKVKAPAGILGSWAIYSDQPLIFGLSVDSAAMNTYDLPTDILDHHSAGRNEYDLRNPEDVKRFEDVIRRYMIEFEKRN